MNPNDKRLGPAPIKFANDLDLDGDLVYFIDSSYERDINDAVEEHMEALPRGRLFSYNERTDQIEFLLENLYMPNGLQLLPSKDAILINENSMARIIKYSKTSKKNFSSYNTSFCCSIFIKISCLFLLYLDSISKERRKAWKRYSPICLASATQFDSPIKTPCSCRSLLFDPRRTLRFWILPARFRSSELLQDS